MPAPVAVIVPTAGRPDYLEVALASIVPQAVELGGEVIVVDDGPSAATRRVAERAGARYVVNDGRGLNAARNTGARATDAPLLVYVDDDVEARRGWLAALVVSAAAQPEEVAVLTGPILARLDGARLRFCGRESPPITHLDLGPSDRDCEHAWGANMTIRRSWLERVGWFDESPRISGAGDEEEWQMRVKAAGGRIRYVAAAALDHRRAGDDARLPALCRSAFHRGQASRRFDRIKGTTPSLADELRTLAGCAAHGPRFRCANGPILTAHALGRLRAALEERLGAYAPPATPGVDDFLAGRSGIATGRTAALLRAQDLWCDLRDLPRRKAVRRAAAALPRRRVLAVGVISPGAPSLMDRAVRELRRSRHEVVVETAPAAPGRGKFENLNSLLSWHDLRAFDWVLVVDDDVALPRGFLDVLLACAEAGGLRLAQPAHRRHSHAAWNVTRRPARGRPADWRETNFVEIGPVTAFSREAAAALLPFPPLAMGWGLDCHWAAVARERGWRIGVVDAAPVAHTLRPTAASYPREAAVAEARAFLADRPYVRRDEVRTLARRRLPR